MHYITIYNKKRKIKNENFRKTYINNIFLCNINNFILACLLVFGWVDIDLVGEIIKGVIISSTWGKVILGVSVVFILLSIKCIFFDTTSREQIKERQGVLLENESGKLMISKETIENLVNSVAKGFKSTEDVTTRVELDKDNNVKVYANLIVSADAVIKDLSANLD